MQERDVIGQAQTGTLEKQRLFGIPLIGKMDPEDEAIPISGHHPTRELAIQVAEEIKIK